MRNKHSRLIPPSIVAYGTDLNAMVKEKPPQKSRRKRKVKRAIIRKGKIIAKPPCADGKYQSMISQKEAQERAWERRRRRW